MYKPPSPPSRLVTQSNQRHPSSTKNIEDRRNPRPYRRKTVIVRSNSDCISVCRIDDVSRWSEWSALACTWASCSSCSNGGTCTSRLPPLRGRCRWKRRSEGSSGCSPLRGNSGPCTWPPFRLSSTRRRGACRRRWHLTRGLGYIPGPSNGPGASLKIRRRSSRTLLLGLLGIRWSPGWKEAY